MEINNYVVEGLVDTKASMFVMVIAMVRELGIMHLVIKSETYKIALGVVTQALGRIDEVPVKVVGIQCTMTFMVVDTNSYDILFGFNFLIKIDVILDLEQGLIQVRHGPWVNVEALLLTMVNLLQRMNSKALIRDVTTVLKNAHISDESDITNWISDQDNPIMPKGVDASALDSNIDTDNSEHYNGGPRQVKQIDDDEEFRDTKFEDLVMFEGPEQIMQLILQEQVNGFMGEEIIDVDDYVDWLKWVFDAKKSKHAMFESTHYVQIPILLEV